MLLPLRALLRARPFALAVVAMLGMGVGALVAAFGVIDAALWRQPPFPDARRLTILYSGRSSPRESLRWERWSFPRLQLLRQAATDFARVANYSPATLTLTGTQDPEHVSGEIVAPDYFPLLGVAALRGRTFAPDEDAAPGAHPIAVLSFDLWQRRFAGDTAVIGRTVGVNGAQLTVVGILPRGFRGLTDRAELWIPTAMAPNLTYADYLTTNQNFISLVARLRDEVPLERAARDLRVLAARINRALPPQDADSAETFTGTVVPVNQARVDPTTRRSLLVLLAGVVLLHLLACANAINLLLGRAAARRRETAVRAALGGTATRLLRHALAEGFLLAAAGGALGLLLAVAASKLANVPANVWFARNFYGSLGTFDTPAVSARTMAVGLLLTLITALAVALAPAATMVRLDLGTALRAESRSSTGGSGSLRRPSARGVVVALEAALGMLLVVTAGLMIDSFARMRHANLGVVPDHVLTFWLRPPDVKVPPADAPRFISNVLDAITRVPGVLAATVDGGAPLSGSARSTLYVMGRPAPPRPEDAPPVDRHYVAPDHFRVLSIPLRRGRAFTDADDARHPRVAIISETAARRFWPAADPIGQRVWFGGGSNFDRPDSSAEIVGIVGDVADEPLDAPSNRASFYTPYRQFTYASRVVFVRTAGDPPALLGAIRKAVRSVDPDLPLYDVQTLEERIGGSWARHRFDAVLFGAFGLAALVLAASGLYAVVAYAVANRTREIGIRLALGARPGTVVRLIVREGMAFPSVGVAAGAVAAFALTRLLRSSLYQVTTTDPRLFGTTIVLLVVVSAVACAIPALRATKIDPAQSLWVE